MRLRLLARLTTIAALSMPVIGLWAADGDDGMGRIHRMMFLVIQLGVILFCAKLANQAFEKLRLPGALGELVIGALIGPYALGTTLGLFHAAENATHAVSPELQGFATVASIVLLFHIGLETDLKLLLRYSLAGGVVGAGGLVVSFLFGAGSVMLFSTLVFDQSLGFFAPPCLLLGTITTATSVGITARILSEKRKLDSPEGVTILTAAVIDDVLGIILLALVTSYISATETGDGVIDWAHIGMIALKAVGVWLAATVIGLIASRRISVLLKLFRDRTTIAIMALGMALVLAGLFEEAGLAMIVGAFVMGLSLSQADIRHVIEEKLAPVHALLVPLFFCVTGMNINAAALFEQPAVLAFGLTYAFAALASKVIGCGGPAMLVGFTPRGALRVGLGMAPRCEVALIIAGVGLGMGMLTTEILAAVIIMVVVNTVVAPPLLVLLFRNPVAGTRKPQADKGDGEERLVFTFPSLQMAEFFITKLNDLLEAEGFFAHCIDRRGNMFQFLKDEAVIDFRCDGSELIFTCRPSEVALVNALMYEGLAAVEQTLRGLRKPLDATSIQTRLQQQPSQTRKGFTIKDYLQPNLIAVELKAEDKEAVIDELLALLQRAGRLRDVAAAREAVMDRERSLSTGLQFGVAIPHAKTDAVDGLVCAVGIKRSGLDFAALDGQPSRIFVLTLSPVSKPSPHLQFMSTVSQVLNEPGREKVLACTTPQQIYKVFCAPVAKVLPKPTAPATTKPKFDPTRYLRPDLVQMELASQTKEGVIRELVELLAEHDLVTDTAEALRTVSAREEALPTGLESGIALPHGRTDAVDDLACAIGLSQRGIDFGGGGDELSHVILLVLTPISGDSPYLQFVAWAMGALSGDGVEQALSAPDAERLCQQLLETRRGISDRLASR